MPRPRKPWSKVVAESGVSVRLYERQVGSLLYREVRGEGGTKDRRSLGHRDRALAEQQARALAKRLAELRFAGQTGALTLGQLSALYLQHAAPLLSPERQRAVRGFIRLLEQGFGCDFQVDDLSEHHLSRYIKARQSGKVRSPRHRGPDAGVRAGTIRNELRHLSTMCRWARGFRLGGRRLLSLNPMDGLPLPAETNTRRPLMSEDRYAKLLAVADQVDPLGRFRLALVLSRTTGRRINAICGLRASDVLRTREQMERALGATGQPVAAAQEWEHGALRWRPERDKRGYDAVVPISREARATLDAYLADHPAVGDAPLLPATNDRSKPAHKVLAGYWLRRAETVAKLPRLERGGYHTMRRTWASERRHLAPTDVMAAGGWKSLEVMRTSYMHADAAGVRAAVELRTADSGTRRPRKARTGGQGASP